MLVHVFMFIVQPVVLNDSSCTTVHEHCTCDWCGCTHMLMITIGGRGSLKNGEGKGNALPMQCACGAGGMRKGTASLSTMHM